MPGRGVDFYSKLSTKPSEASDEYFKHSGLYLEKLRLSCGGRRRGQREAGLPRRMAS